MVEDKIKIYPISALSDNYIWVIVGTDHHSALVVDPGDAAPVIAVLKQHHLKLKGILLTHHHWDHVNGVPEIIRHYPVPVWGYVHSQYPLITHQVDADDWVDIDVNFPTFKVMTIPGHTLDHIAWYAEDALFCGDTLFAGGCGRLFEGTASQMYASLQKIAALPDQTAIYCAHEYTYKNLQFAQLVEPGNQQIKQRIKKVSVLRENNEPSLPSLLIEEKQTNPFLRCDIPEVIQQVGHHCQRVLTQPVDVFAELRKWKDGL